MSAPSALRAIAALLAPDAHGALTFPAKADEPLDRVLSRVAEGALAEVEALLGLVVVLREDRGSPEAAEQLERALRRSPVIIRGLIAVDDARRARERDRARRLALEVRQLAPAPLATPPPGTLPRARLGGDPSELERRRAGRG